MYNESLIFSNKNSQTFQEDLFLIEDLNFDIDSVNFDENINSSIYVLNQTFISTILLKN